MTTDNRCICSARLSLQPFSEHFDALRCSHCGSRHFVAAANGAPAPEFRYDGENEKYTQQSYLYGKQLRWAHNQLLRQTWSGRKVLEIGCFNGFFLDELRKRGADVYGFDVNREALAVGEELFGLGGRLDTSMSNLALCGPFDDVLCIDVLEHLDQPETFLQEVSTMLKPGGRIVVAGPTIERQFHDKSDFPPHHKWWFSRSGMKAFLQQSGFEVTSIDVQRDGLLLLRNFLGKAIAGLRKREFYGEAVITTPSLDGVISRNLYAGLSALGTMLFTMLRISYCSAILTATKVRTA